MNVATSLLSQPSEKELENVKNEVLTNSIVVRKVLLKLIFVLGLVGLLQLSCCIFDSTILAVRKI